jgi:hypothetical protein
MDQLLKQLYHCQKVYAFYKCHIIIINDGDDDSDLDKPVFLPRDSKLEPVPSLPSILEKLKRNLSNEKEKLKVDGDDLLNDAMAYYKDPDFNPRKRLRVIYNNQPAADTGGVTRQFFYAVTWNDF